MNPIDNILKQFPLVILDGAMATELEKHDCDLNDSLWSAKILMESPEKIYQVHMDYFLAGSDCATTASYQATVEGFMKRGLSGEEALKLIRYSVELASKARDDFWSDPKNRTNRPKPLVAASIGPYGAYLADGSEYRGDYKLSEEELIEFHRPRMKTLIDAGADVLACETIPCLKEAVAVARLLKEFPDTYAWISFSCKDEKHISNGESIAGCAEKLEEYPQIAAIGINCTPPQFISSLIQEIKTGKPIIVYPNLGETYDPITKTWNGASASKNYSSNAKSWYELGARLIGGCCRTGPREIRAISEWARG